MRPAINKERGLAEVALQRTKLPTSYQALRLVQRPFGWVFWFIEQRKAQIQDRFENERSDL